MFQFINKYIKNERSSITLWVTLSLPVIIILFFFLFLRTNNIFQGTRYLQNVGDLASSSAVSQINMNSLFTVPLDENEPLPLIEEDAAITVAQEYLKDNLSQQSDMFTSDVIDLIDKNDLSVAETNYMPTIPDQEGIAIIVLNDRGISYNPATDEPITSPSVLIVMQFRMNVMAGTQIVTTYSIASI